MQSLGALALQDWGGMARFYPMKSVSIRDAKNRLTELAREVEAGEPLL